MEWLKWIWGKFKALVGYGFGVMGVLFTVYSWVKPVFYPWVKSFFSIPDENTLDKYMLCVALAAGLIVTAVRWLCGCPWSRTYQVGRQNRKIRVWAGNLLNVTDGSIVVSVNNELTCDPARIGPQSLHNQILQKYQRLFPAGTPAHRWMEDEFQAQMQQIQQSQQNSALPPSQVRAPYGYSFQKNSPDGRQSFIFLVTSELQAAQGPVAPNQNLKTAIDVFFSSGAISACYLHKLYMPPVGLGAAGNATNLQDLMEYIAFQYIRNVTKPASGANVLGVQNVQELVLAFRPKKLSKLPNIHQRLKDMIRKCSYGCCYGDLP